MLLDDLFGALLRGGITAACVAALLLAAQRWGRDIAGLLAGLPTVTGPALVWLALDHGPSFGGQAAHGAVLAGAACAVFALAYGRASLVMARPGALCVASVLCLPPLALLFAAPLPLGAALAVVVTVCLACVQLLPRVASRALPAPGRAAAVRAGLTTAMVSGAVSALASLLAPHLSALWAGALTSPPILAAAVAWELQRQGCPARVLDFLRGYTAGLIGRCAFVAVFGALLVPAGLLPALVAALALALALGWGTGVWMKWRHRIAVVQRTNP